MVFGINLLPQEDKFYELIAESGELSFTCVNLLNSVILSDDRERITKLGEDIGISKNRAKSVMAELTSSLSKTFITPLDREDIHSLATGLYKIPKLCDKVQERILMFHIHSRNDDFQKLSDNMMQVADLLYSMLNNLKSLKNTELVYEKSSSINNVEGVTDALLSNLLLQLFQDEQDIKQLLLRREIYNLMEEIVDRHRDMGNILLEISLKNA